MRHLLDFSGLSHQSFSRGTFVFTRFVSWNGWALLFYEAFNNIKQGIPDWSRASLCCFILHELQLYPLYRSNTGPVALQT
jgi:hypothetical protein